MSYEEQDRSGGIKEMLRNFIQCRQYLLKIPVFIPVFAVKICEWLLCKYRKCKYGYAFRQIPLTKGKVAVVDPEDFHKLNRYKWCASKRQHTFYAVRSQVVNKKRKTILMHRQVINAGDGRLVDHVNHDGLDNRKANLRLATYCQNNTNTRKRVRPGKSEYRGVQWSRQRNKWVAIIRYRKNREFLGYFIDQKEAARAYDRAAKNITANSQFLILTDSVRIINHRAILVQSAANNVRESSGGRERCKNSFL